jgi:hypothetical protein
MGPRRILRTHGWHFQFHKKQNLLNSNTNINCSHIQYDHPQAGAAEFTSLITAPEAQCPPPLPSPVAYNKDDTFMLRLLVHLSCVKWSVLHLSFVVCRKEWCMWIALSVPLSTAYVLQYQLQTKCNNCVRTARRLCNVLSGFLYYLMTFHRQGSCREKWQHVSDWRTYEGKQSCLVFIL